MSIQVFVAFLAIALSPFFSWASIEYSSGCGLYSVILQSEDSSNNPARERLVQEEWHKLDDRPSPQGPWMVVGQKFQTEALFEGSGSPFELTQVTCGPEPHQSMSCGYHSDSDRRTRICAGSGDIYLVDDDKKIYGPLPLRKPVGVLNDNEISVTVHGQHMRGRFADRYSELIDIFKPFIEDALTKEHNRFVQDSGGHGPPGYFDFRKPELENVELRLDTQAEIYAKVRVFDEVSGTRSRLMELRVAKCEGGRWQPVMEYFLTGDEEKFQVYFDMAMLGTAVADGLWLASKSSSMLLRALAKSSMKKSMSRTIGQGASMAPTTAASLRTADTLKATTSRCAAAVKSTEQALRPVGRVLESVDDVLANPNLLAGKSPAQVQAIIGKTLGWKIETLGKGSKKGQGWVFRQYNDRGQATGQSLRWHPGGGHHGPDPYWRVTSNVVGKSDIIR